MAILKEKSKQPEPFKYLQSLQNVPGETNLGGDFALPREFDQKRFASAFIPKGNAVTHAQGRQVLTGTNFTAQGWSIWKYPEQIPTGELNEKGKPVMEKHPKADERHEVTSRIKDGGTFVLMYRDKEVQREVNQAYANLSRERMNQEATGQTVAGAHTEEDRGMLGKQRLPSEPEDEQYEPPVAVEEVSLPTYKNINKKVKQVRQ